MRDLIWYKRKTIDDDDLPMWLSNGWIIEQHDDEFLIGYDEEFITFSRSFEGAQEKVRKMYNSIVDAKYAISPKQCEVQYSGTPWVCNEPDGHDGDHRAIIETIEWGNDE